MSTRPPQIRYLTAGKALGAKCHAGWVATWNWVLSFVNHFAGGKGMKVSNASSGHPRADVLIEAGEGISVNTPSDGEAYVISLADTSDGGEGGGGGGVTSFNELTGDVEVKAGSGSVTVGETKIKVKVETEGQKIKVSLEGADKDEPEEDDDDKGYCNEVSNDSEDGLGEGNAISGDGVDFWGGIGASMGSNPNAISQWPCKKKGTS